MAFVKPLSRVNILTFGDEFEFIRLIEQSIRDFKQRRAAKSKDLKIKIGSSTKRTGGLF